MVMQLTPMSVFAESAKKRRPASIDLKKDAPLADIASEVKEKRTEFSKTYLLEDGSYCNISTYAPIHNKVNGVWENIDSSLNKSVKHIDDAKNLLQDASVGQNEKRISGNSKAGAASPSSPTITSSLIVNTSACNVTDGVISLRRNGALVAKLSQLENYFDQNKLVTRATVDMDCTVAVGATVELKEKTGSWTASTVFNINSLKSEHTLDIKTCSTSDSHCSWDITDLYSKWDKNAINNNGFVLYVSSRNSNISIASLSVTVIYRDIDETDANSTYHTVDMGRAGTVYVNDLTSTVKLEQDILRIPRTAMPIYLKRIYTLSDTFASGTSDGLRWNYESSINLVNGIAAWKTFNGTVKRFVQSNPVVNEDGYTKWHLVSNDEQGNAQPTTLWIKSTELNNSSYDYSKFYILSNYTKYIFDTAGRLIEMQIRNDPDNCILFNYSNDKLANVSYTDGDITSTISFIYSSNQIIVHFSTFNEMSEESTYQEIVRVQNTYNSSDNTTKVKVFYNDNKSVEYKYDYWHKLVKVTDENGSTLDLSYVGTAITGNRLFSYSKEDVTNSSNEYMIFNDYETYYRLFESSASNLEEIEYDKDFRIICHWDCNGNYTFVSYDEDGSVNSYVIPENNPNVLYENGFNSEDDCLYDIYHKTDSIVEFKEYSEFTSGSSILSLEQRGIGCMKLDVPESRENYACVDVPGLEANKTYVFGAWVYIESSCPSGTVNISAESTNSDTSEIFEFNYDVCATGYWQYRLMAFKLNEDSDILVSLNFKDQLGVFYVDNMVLYEASEAQVDALESIIGVTPFDIQNNADGSVNREVISDGITSLFNAYTYENNQISSVTDTRGVTTYYGYDSNTGTLNEIGTLIDGNGNIINPTELVTGLNGLPTYIEQNVKNISTNTNREMVSSYTYDQDERICSIASNGVTYSYEYTADKLTGVSKNNNEMVEYNYSDNKIGSIVYNNGFSVNYSYENDVITEVDFIKNNTSVKKYEYEYNNDGKIQNIVESVSNMKITYTNVGFEIYSLEDSTAYPIYTYSEDENGTVIEKYYPDVVSDKSAEYKNKVCITKTTSKDEKYVDALTGETTISSNQTINKILNWSNENDYDNSIYHLSKYTVNDYFGRISEKSTTITNNINNSGIRVAEDFSYKELSATTTSTLISSHTSKIDSISSENIVTNMVNEKNYYEYDDAGNVVFEYRKDGGVIRPIAYYEYDVANQLIGEYNISNQLSATYTYDNGGNITSKIYHNVSSVICDTNTHKVVNYGTVSNTVTYSYDVNSKDLLTNFNGTDITYDNYGNPLVYSGERYTTFTSSTINNSSSRYNNKYSVSGTCEWTGEYLTAFETDTNRYLYSYDESGNRIKKTCMNKDNGVFETSQELFYIWDGELLTGIIYKNYGNDSVSSAEIEILYDQKGEPIGFVFDDELEWYFVKDYNGSVTKIVDSAGNEVTTISYDGWGQANFCFNADIETPLGVARYIILSFAITLNPICYKGYLFDYESGLYFAKDKVYSPAWGRYLNHVDFENKLTPSYSVNSTNMYAFCNNNPINTFDPYSYVSTIRAEYFANSELASGVDVEMNKAFLSRVFCGIFANSLVKKFGSWEYNSGYTAYGMEAEYIAKNLFAHNLAKYELAAMNAVNASWGDGWSDQNSYNDSVKVYKNDINRSKYEMIWNAANSIIQTT